MNTEIWVIWIVMLSIAAVGVGIYPRGLWPSQGRLIASIALTSFGLSGFISSLVVTLMKSS